MTIAEIAEKVIKIREETVSVIDIVLAEILRDVENEEQKTALIERIKKAQASVPEWK